MAESTGVKPPDAASTPSPSALFTRQRETLDRIKELNRWPEGIDHIFADGLAQVYEAEYDKLSGISEEFFAVVNKNRALLGDMLDEDLASHSHLDAAAFVVEHVKQYAQDLRLLILRGDKRVCTTRTSVPGFELYVTRGGLSAMPVWVGLAFSPKVSPDHPNAIRLSVPKGAYEITDEGNFRLFFDYEGAWKGHVAVGRELALDARAAREGDLSNCTLEVSLFADSVIAVHGHPAAVEVRALSPTSLAKMLDGVPPALGQPTYWQNPKYYPDGTLRASAELSQGEHGSYQNDRRSPQPVFTAEGTGVADDLDDDPPDDYPPSDTY